MCRNIGSPSKIGDKSMFFLKCSIIFNFVRNNTVLLCAKDQNDGKIEPVI